MNKVLKYLIISDFFFWTAMGFVGPILAVYFTDDIDGGTLSLTGIAIALFWIVKSITALVTSHFTDHEKGNKRKLYTLISGSAVLVLVPCGFVFAADIHAIIIIQIIYGFGAGLAYPGWMTLYTRFMSDGHEGFMWSLDNVITNVGYAVAIAASGVIAEFLGFSTLFYVVIVLNLISFVSILILLKYKDDILSNHNIIRYYMRRFF